MKDFATSKPTSMPTRSMSSKGPMRKPPPRRQIRSICSWPASRSPNSRNASALNGRPQRLTRKPGPSAARITCLPIASPVSRATASARSPVWSARMTSSRPISGGGLKKCIPTTFSGRAAAPASEVTGIEDVLVASTAPGSQISDRRSNSSRLRSGRSGAASMTSSQSASLSRASTGSSSPAASSPARPFSTHRPRPARAASAPRSSASGTGSCSRVRMPAAAPSCAIPAPMVPAPTTPTVRGRELTAP